MARARPRPAAASARSDSKSRIPFPDGVNDGHADSRPFHRFANIVSILILGSIVGAALLGLFGGGKSTPVEVATPSAVFTVTTPQVMRSGIFFETRVTVAARQPITDVVIALPPALWRDQTINTTVPQAEKEQGDDGTFRLHYGPLPAGKTLEVKVDGQINPPLFAGTQGSISLLDGERQIAMIPLHLRVWP